MIEELYINGKLGAHTRGIARFHTGSVIARLYDQGWQISEGIVVAAEARNMLELMENAVGPDLWPAVLRVISSDYKGDDCSDLVPLIIALDILAPMIGVVSISRGGNECRT